MLHCLHSLYNRLKGGGMCAAACSMWWLAWILYKTTQLEGSYQSGGTWSTGAALVSALTKGRKKPQPCDIQTKTSSEQCTDGGHGCSFHFFLPLSASAFSFGGAAFPHKAQSKHSSVNMGWNTGKHGLLWRVCWVSDRVWWTFLILSLWCYFLFLPGEMFWEAWSPPHPPTQGSPVEPWQPNKWLPLLLTVTFNPWALTCPAERGCLRSLPGSITSFPLEQLKRLAV